MQHKLSHKNSHKAKQEPSVKHKLSFHVTAAFAAIGLITTASKIIAH
jgi:hypothetical protein